MSREKIIPVLFNKKEECCGCTACMVICVKNAIQMVVDEKGFYYPWIDESKCIRCYQCVHICPIGTAANWNC